MPAARRARARFVPRILAADPATLLDASGENFEPASILACMMQREKSGGHSERSIAIGTIEVALWDAVAKIAGKPLHRLLAERYNGGKVAAKVFRYVGGGWYWPGQTVADLQDEMRRHLDAGYTMVKMKVGALPLDEDLRRVEAVRRFFPPTRSSPSTPIRNSCATRRSPMRGRWRRSSCAGSRSRAIRSILRCSRRSPAAMTPRSRPARTFSTQDVENLVRFGGLRPDRNDVIQIDPPHAYGIVQYARTVDMLERHGWPRSALFPHGGNQMSLAIAGGFASAAPNPIPACSVRSAALPTTPSSTAATCRWATGPASASRANRRSIASCASSRPERAGGIAFIAPDRQSIGLRLAGISTPTARSLHGRRPALTL